MHRKVREEHDPDVANADGQRQEGDRDNRELHGRGAIVIAQEAPMPPPIHLTGTFEVTVLFAVMRLPVRVADAVTVTKLCGGVPSGRRYRGSADTGTGGIHRTRPPMSGQMLVNWTDTSGT